METHFEAFARVSPLVPESGILTLLHIRLFPSPFLEILQLSIQDLLLRLLSLPLFRLISFVLLCFQVRRCF